MDHIRKRDTVVTEIVINAGKMDRINQTIIFRREKVSGQLLAVFRVLSSANALHFIDDDHVLVLCAGKTLLQVTSKKIITPVTKISDSIFGVSSSLPDSFVSSEDLIKFVDQLRSKITGLNHVGFCYTVQSQEQELVRIKIHVGKSSFHLYEMESMDLAKWYFVGDRHNWKDPLIELLPVLPNDDPTMASWMPHIHIDINTQWSAKNIEDIVHTTLGNLIFTERKVDPIYGPYSVRICLGRIAGMNINIDVATNVRNVKWVRENMLRELQ